VKLTEYNTSLIRNRQGVDYLSEATTAAILAMILIGCADTINKRARQRAIPIGSYLIVQSVSYTLVILLMALMSGGIKWQRADLVYGLLGAVFGFAGFTLMLHSLTRGHAGVNYAIFRSSFAFSAGSAIVILDEALYINKIIGIMLACLAIALFFYDRNHLSVVRRSLLMAFAAMLIAAAFQMIIKLSTRVFSSPISYILLMNLFFFGFVVVYALIARNFRFPRTTFVLAPANGVMMALATFFYVTALQKGELSTVMPIIQLSFTFTAILAAIFLKDRISTRQIFGIICAGIAIIAMGAI